MSLFASIDRVLPPESTKRRVAANVAGVAFAALAVTILLPRPAPASVWVSGFVRGMGDAMLAVGIVLVWRSARVVNFAQAAMGAMGAYFAFVLVGVFHVPFVIAVPICLLLGAGAGFLINVLFVQRFFNSPRLVVTVVTIVVARFLGNSRDYVNGLPVIKGHVGDLNNQDFLEQSRMQLPFGHSVWKVLGVPLDFAALFTVFAAVCALGGLALWMRRSRLGTAVRGVAVNAERAQSLGINVRSVGAAVWTMTGAFAALGLLLRGISEGFVYGNTDRAPEQFLIPALAAAVLGRMTNISTAVVTAVTIGMVSVAVVWSYPNTAVVELGLLAVIAGGLLLQRRRGSRSEDGESSSWEATKEIRPIPKELSTVPEIRRTRRILIGVVLVVTAAAPFAMSGGKTHLVTVIFIQAIVALSLIVLTGWSGTVSLGQFALVAVAAVLSSNLTSSHGVPFWVALPLVAALTGGFAVLLGIPALRIRGAFLAVTTLAFAVAAQSTLFQSGWFRTIIPLGVNRPRLLFISFESERSYYFLCLAMLLGAVFVVRGLRHSRTGRVLIAARENESGVESFGVSLMRIRLAAFAVSGALAGVAGVLFVHHQRAVDVDVYAASVSVDMFIMTMVGGIGATAGAVLGAAYIGLVTFLIRGDVIRNVVTSGGLLLLLFIAPGGLAGLVTQARDGVLRIVALRRGIAVPSLFEDADLEAVATRRAPLVQRIPYRGLEAIPEVRRYTRPSELHGRTPTRQEVPA
ncbi:MAG: branched-chain amino acid transport system permease protein livM [Acidimicrobiaceae bacterium]|jgi:branched-chain amino acid transport system permease protein|nr:branched-chain amino acid transport system permease protein livM [Acidimicrobiaceae bacterium]MDQ1444526.1 branched-chain amino acid transport system permease protein livM [Acidimicrobiaceae bacterium]